jgi:hypothetical protein
LKIQPSPHNTAKSQQRWYKTINGWKSLLEVIAIPFGIGYAVITYYQWKDLRHHFELDERAWLNIRHDSPFKEGSHAPPDLVSGLVDKVQLVNVGKTAARNLRLLCKAEVLSSSTAPSFDYTKNGSSATRGLLFQGDTITLEFGSANEISKEQGVSLLAGESYIAFYGVVAYDDIFGKPHETRICWWRHFHANMTASARSCTDYNYTDGN